MNHLVAEHDRMMTDIGDKNLRAIGLGWAMKGGRHDPSRGQVLVYVVRKKKKLSSIPEAQRIPRKVTLYVTVGKGKNRRRRRVVMQTDVVEIPRAIQTGAEAVVNNQDGTQSKFTAGALVRWGQNPFSWGLLTVAHGVANVALGLIGAAPNVNISFPGVPAPINGTVLAQTQETDPLDAALIGIAPDIVAAQLAAFLPAPDAPLPTVRTPEQLQEDGMEGQPAGFSLTTDGWRPFVITAYVPNPAPDLIENGPNRRPLLLVHSHDNYVFVPGTSGSVWVGAGNVVDAIEIATIPDRNDNGVLMHMADRLGQPVQQYLDWAASLPCVGGNEVQLVAVF